MKYNFFSYLAECLGTLLLMYTILATGHPVPIGLSLIIAVYLGAKVSGSHFNPVVTVICALKGQFPKYEVLPYVVSQLAGGLIALELFKISKKR